MTYKPINGTIPQLNQGQKRTWKSSGVAGVYERRWLYSIRLIVPHIKNQNQNLMNVDEINENIVQFVSLISNSTME